MSMCCFENKDLSQDDFWFLKCEYILMILDAYDDQAYFRMMQGFDFIDGQIGCGAIISVLLRRPLGGPNISWEGIWRILED